MAVDIGYVSAVGAGALSFLSPCVLPLVPPYLCYMAGVTVEDFRGTGAATVNSRAVRAPLLAASIAFVESVTVLSSIALRSFSTFSGVTCADCR